MQLQLIVTKSVSVRQLHCCSWPTLSRVKVSVLSLCMSYFIHTAMFFLAKCFSDMQLDYIVYVAHGNTYLCSAVALLASKSFSVLQLHRLCCGQVFLLYTHYCDDFFFFENFVPLQFYRL